MLSRCLGRRTHAALAPIASAIVATCLCAGSAHGDGLADMASRWQFRTRVGGAVFSDCVFVSPDVVSDDGTVARYSDVCVNGVAGAAGEGRDGSIVIVVPNEMYCQAWRIDVQRGQRIRGTSDYLAPNCRDPLVDGSVTFPFRGTRASCGRHSACRDTTPSP